MPPAVAPRPPAAPRHAAAPARGRRPWWRGLLLAGATALAACSTAPDAAAEVAGGAEPEGRAVVAEEGAPDEVGTTTGESADEATGGTADEEGADTSLAPVTFVFGGDVHFEGRVERSLGGRDEGPLAGMAGAYGPEDIVVVNLETAITESTGAVSKSFTFKAPPEVLDELVRDGVDVVTLANNHGMDFGAVGLTDTLAAAEAAGLPLVGAGMDASEAFTPWTTTVEGHRVAVLGATQVLDNAFATAWTAATDHPGLASAKDPDLLLDAVTRAAAEADTVAVVLHWGVEKETCPTAAQQDLAGALVDAGADIVVGGHAHRLQGAGRMGKAIVGYGLGNLVFDVPDNGESARTGMLRVRSDGRGALDYEWVPATIVGGLPQRLEGTARSAAMEDWTARRGCTGLTD